MSGTEFEIRIDDLITILGDEAFSNLLDGLAQKGRIRYLGKVDDEYLRIRWEPTSDS